MHAVHLPEHAGSRRRIPAKASRCYVTKQLAQFPLLCIREEDAVIFAAT